MNNRLLRFACWVLAAAPLLLVAACRQNPSPAETASVVDPTRAAHIRDSIARDEAAIKQRLHLDNFPLAWTRLQDLKGQRVIFQPCNLDVPAFELAKRGETIELYENMGDDGIQYEVLSLEHTGNTYTFNARNPDNKKEISVRCEYDPATGVGHWVWQHNFGEHRQNDYFYAANNTLTKYRTVIQPCRECYPASECTDDAGKAVQ